MDERPWRADALRAVMTQQGFSIRMLASKLGVSVRTVMRWRAEGPPDYKIAEIVEALGAHMSALVQAPVSEAAYLRMLDELESFRRRAAQEHAQNAELRSQLERMQRLDRRPQELLKPNAQRRSTGS